MELIARQLYTGSKWLENVRLRIENGLIAELAENVHVGADALPLIVPGMGNVHSHAFQRAFAGFSEYSARGHSSFWSWRQVMYQFLEGLTPEDVFTIARWLYIEMLKVGYTAVGEFHYIHHNQDGSAYDDPAEMSHRVIQGAQEAGIAITHLPVLYAYSGFNNAPPLDGQKRFLHNTEGFARLLDRLYGTYTGNSEVTIGIAPHSLRAVSLEMIRDAVAALDGHNAAAPIHIHIAEQTKEVEDCIEATGEKPLGALLKAIDLDQRWCLVHGTNFEHSEIFEVVERGAVIGYCPTTEANLGDGLSFARVLLEKGGHMGIGSDSNISVNPMEELRTFEYGQRLWVRERAYLSTKEEPHSGAFLYKKSLAGGARALGMNAGELAAGKRADLLVLNDESPCLWAKKKDTLLDGWVFAGSDNPVRHVMVGGAWRVKDGRHHLEENAYEEFKKVQARLALG